MCSVIYITVFSPEDPKVSELAETSCLSELIYETNWCGPFVCNITMYSTQWNALECFCTEWRSQIFGMKGGWNYLRVVTFWVPWCWWCWIFDYTECVQRGTFKIQPYLQYMNTFTHNTTKPVAVFNSCSRILILQLTHCLTSARP
jgi:hypothetical protein